MTGRPDRAALLAQESARDARRRGAARTLLLDLDGTLAPIAPRPQDARVPPETLAAIRRLLRQGWTVAVVSGRPASQVRMMVPVRGVRVFGSHGLEGSWKGGGPGTPPSGPRSRLRKLYERGRAAARGVPGALVEAKPAGVAFHDRRIPPARLARWRRTVREILARSDLSGLEILRGRRVLEVRPSGWSKGTVVRTFPGLGRLRSPDRSLLAIGDDRTDEDMFREIRGKGLGVLAGRSRRATAAARRLGSPAQVRRFLELLGDSAGKREPSSARR